jgi:hypothetical protein
VWTWGDDVLVNDVIALVGNVTGVDTVTSVTTPSGTVTIAVDELVHADTVTVNAT